MIKKSFPGGSIGKESACSVGDLGSIPQLGRSPEEGNNYPSLKKGITHMFPCGKWLSSERKTLAESGDVGHLVE